MGVNPTPTNFKTFTFDGANSRSYGVYITGEGVFNAPERAIEMVSIPGRNGAYALDQGRFENIEVTYPAGIVADTETDFAAAVSNLRNLLCSKNGYVRLEDDYNPDEYRLAIYKSGLEVSHDMLTNGEFDIVFDCKPQRFLKSGETAVSVSSGGTITNPTLFDALPLLSIEGTGNINVNGKNITIQNSVVGDYVVVYQDNVSGTYYLADFSNVYIATGNTIDTDSIAFAFDITNRDNAVTFTSQSTSNITGNPDLSPSATGDGTYVGVVCPINDETYTYGTPSSNTIGFDVNITNSNSISASIHVEVTSAYDGNKRIEYSAQIGYVPSAFVLGGLSMDLMGAPSIVVHSTAATFGNPTYIDCDIGSAYAIDNGVISSLDSYVQLGANLPVLSSGINTITYDNTVTTLKVTPRWWKV